MPNFEIAVAGRCWGKKSNLLLNLAAILLVTLSTQELVHADVPEFNRSAVMVPNVVLIMADDLGYGDVGCFGQQRIKTPTLDRMAAEGMKLTDFYSGSTVCAPSRCVLMTGYHTGHCFIRGNARDNLRPDDVTIAEVMKSAGYKTALCGKWGLGEEGSDGVPTRQGFDFFYGYLNQHHAHNYYPAYLFRNEKRVPLDNVVPGKGDFGSNVASKKVVYSHNLIMDEALQWVKANHADPFFLYLALTIPHANNEAGKQGMEVPDYGIYADKDWPDPQKGHAAMITLMDRDIGRLLDLLKQLGIDDNTLVLFTSDNGPHAEGGNNPNFQNSNGPLRGIKRSLTEGGIRVPTIARWPGKIKPGSSSDFIGCFQDMMPTLAELAGTERKTYPADIDGISFLPTLIGKGEQAQHESLYWAFYEQGGARGLRMGNWKAVQQPINTPIRLYDLGNDISESNDIAARHPTRVEQMRDRMDASYAPSGKWKFPTSK